MKNFLAILLLQIFAGTMYGQNHVHNGDFEDFVQCPTSFSQLARATGWRQFTAGTADYLNICNTGPAVSIPQNHAGYQQPASGKGYAGIYAYQERDYKEYLARQIAPLIKGVRYEVSMSVSLANYSGYAINDLSMYLYINGPVSIPSVFTVNYKPQVSLP
jgi:OmpA-OmpF porin, OOP family